MTRLGMRDRSASSLRSVTRKEGYRDGLNERQGLALHGGARPVEFACLTMAQPAWAQGEAKDPALRVLPRIDAHPACESWDPALGGRQADIQLAVVGPMSCAVGC